MWRYIFAAILLIYIFAPLTQLTAGTRTMLPTESLALILGVLAIPLVATGWLAYGRG